MLKVHEKKWSELSFIWHEFYEQNPTATPFQSYEFLTFTGKGKPYRKDLFRLLGVREWNLLLEENGRPIAIAPLLIKRKQKKWNVYLRGHFTVANQLDFIYAGLTYQQLKYLMDYVKTALGGSVAFLLDRISEKTVTCGYLKEYFAAANIEEQECFSIPIAADYGEWLKTLSRSARGNLKTYFNRLDREGLDWSVEFFFNQSIRKALCKKLMRVYAERFAVKNGFSFGIFRKPVIWMLDMYLMRDQMTRWMNRKDGHFHAVFYIGSRVAAFASCLLCRDKRIIVSRLSISTEYARFSPGGLLLSSVIKHIIGQNAKGEMDVKELDLSQGGEGGMSYKKTYGGQPHSCFVFYG